jgi:hypothetical protein
LKLPRPITAVHLKKRQLIQELLRSLGYVERRPFVFQVGMHRKDIPAGTTRYVLTPTDIIKLVAHRPRVCMKWVEVWRQDYQTVSQEDITKRLRLDLRHSIENV